MVVYLGGYTVADLLVYSVLVWRCSRNEVTAVRAVNAFHSLSWRRNLATQRVIGAARTGPRSQHYSIHPRLVPAENPSSLSPRSLFIPRGPETVAVFIDLLPLPGTAYQIVSDICVDDHFPPRRNSVCRWRHQLFGSERAWT